MPIAGPRPVHAGDWIPAGFHAQTQPVRDPTALSWFRARFPGHPDSDFVYVSSSAALVLAGAASANSLTALDLFTDGLFRGSKIYWFDGEALAAVDREYETSLISAIRGNDTSGASFAMSAMVGGESNIAVYYPRDAIKYLQPVSGKEFKFASSIRYKINAPRHLAQISGLKVWSGWPWPGPGWVDVEQIKKDGASITVYAYGGWQPGVVARPIARRGKPPVRRLGLLERPWPELERLKGSAAAEAAAWRW